MKPLLILEFSIPTNVQAVDLLNVY